MRNVLPLIASLGLAACVGGVEGASVDDPDPQGPGGGGTGPAAAEAKKLFTDNVQPVIVAQCISCHNITGPVGNITGFVDADKAQAYSTATGYQAVIGDFTPTGAGIITKIKVNPTVSHSSIVYSDENLNKITAWLSKELEARSGGGGSGSGSAGGETAQQASARVLNEWSACMTLANFDAANMKAWGTVQSGDGACDACHSNGAFSHIAARTSQPFFDVISQDKNFMLMYFSVDMTGGVAGAKMIVNERSFTAVAQRLAPHYTHPQFNLNNAGKTALTAFYTSTMNARMAAGAAGCGPSKLRN